MKVYMLLKPLPLCPAGRLFKRSEGSFYFHSMTDEEFTLQKFSEYQFPEDQFEKMVEDGWFKEITLNDESTFVPNPTRLFIVSYTSNDEWELEEGYYFTRAKDEEEAKARVSNVLMTKKSTSTRDYEVMDVNEILEDEITVFISDPVIE